MRKEQLEKYTSGLEMELHKVACDEIKFNEEFEILSVFQSHCDFNLFWLYSISPGVVLHLESLRFLNDNSKHFKRKLTIKDVFRFDTLINYHKPGNFEEFKKLLITK